MRGSDRCKGNEYLAENIGQKQRHAPLETPYSASKIRIPGIDLARVQENNMMAEIVANRARTLIGPTRCATMRGAIRPKIEQPLLMANLARGRSVPTTRRISLTSRKRVRYRSRGRTRM